MTKYFVIKNYVKYFKKKYDQYVIGLILFRIKLLLKNKERFKEYKIKISNYIIYLNDPLSFYYEFRDIFKNQIYYFYTEKKDPFIIDGGGFIGASVVYFKNIYPDSEILVFEPDKNALNFLHKNIETNQLKNIKVIESGLYSEDTELNFNPDNADGGKIDEAGDLEIKVEKLSKYINKNVDFLKLNIEGAELEVFQDLDKNDKWKFINELCIECHSFKGEGQDLDEILKILKYNNFKYYISNFEGSPKGKFCLDENTQFYLLVYAKKNNPIY